MAAVETVNLTKTFENVTAVKDLNIQVQEGEIFGLVGPDGAGKTTTIRLLTAVLEPTSGHGRVYDKDIIKESFALRENIAYMPQRFGLYEDLTVIENMNFYADIYCLPYKQKAPKIESLLEFSNLKQFKKRLARNLSGGMKQKLGLTCALIHNPKVLFLDEPTNGVDPVSRRDFWKILYQLLEEKVTIVISTSYLEEAEKCNTVALMHKGMLLKCDKPSAIKQETNSKSIQDAFISIIKDYERKSAQRS
jgi:ABC-2 type transport system ATP-binding protein